MEMCISLPSMNQRQIQSPGTRRERVWHVIRDGQDVVDDAINGHRTEYYWRLVFCPGWRESGRVIAHNQCWKI